MPNKRVFVIAEAGINHNARLDYALQLVDEAVNAQADAVKFQAAIPDLVATEAAEKTKYQRQNTGSSESQLEMIRNAVLPLSEFQVIANYCRKKNIVFFATAFDAVSLQFLHDLDIPYHKVPSGDITNVPYLRQIGSYKKPVILSTGMCSMSEIQFALDTLEVAGADRQKVTVLHCNTAYPTPMQDVHLRAMCQIRSEFNVDVGYSDHTLGISVSLAAVALGATIIEKHLTLDKDMSGPDHRASLEPKEFAELVRGIREVEAALGSESKRPSPSEEANSILVRRSLVAARPIKKGEVFTPENLIAKRPGTGIPPTAWDHVLGRKAKKAFNYNELIEL